MDLLGQRQLISTDKSYKDPFICLSTRIINPKPVLNIFNQIDFRIQIHRYCLNY